MSESLQRSVNVLFKEHKWTLEWKEDGEVRRAISYDTLTDTLASVKNTDCINWLCKINN